VFSPCSLLFGAQSNPHQVLELGTANSSGYRRSEVRGTYMLSNLLQELTLALDYGREHIILDEARLNENPVERLTRLIKTTFWNGLTRQIDVATIDVVAKDPKAERMADPRPRIYVPKGAPEQLEYYHKVARERPSLDLDVVELPENITAEYVKSMLCLNLEFDFFPGLISVCN
jgi:alpha,alpha-trehalase